MIDVENQIITKVSDAVKVSYPNIFVTSVDVITEQDIPCIVIAQTDNRVRTDMTDSGDLENGVISTVEITAYSNTPDTARSEAKAILALADTAMKAMGYTRVTMLALPTTNVTVCRMFARYEATVDKNELTYRR